MTSYHIYNKIPITSLRLSDTSSYTRPYPFHNWHPPVTVTFLLFRHASSLHPGLHTGCFLCLGCTSNQFFMSGFSVHMRETQRGLPGAQKSKAAPLHRTHHIMRWCFLQVEKKESECDIAQSCPTPCDPTDYSLPHSSVHGIFRARVLEGVAISFSRRSSWPRDQILVSQEYWRGLPLPSPEDLPDPGMTALVSRIIGRRFTIWAPGKP